MKKLRWTNNCTARCQSSNFVSLSYLEGPTMYQKRLPVLVVCLSLLLPSLVLASADFQRVKQRMSKETDELCNQVEGILFESKRIMNNSLERLYKEVEANNGPWEDFDRLNTAANQISLEMLKIRRGYLPKVKVAVSKIEGTTPSGPSKVSKEIKEAIENLGFIEECFSNWRLYAKKAIQGSENVGKKLDSSFISTLNICVETMDEESFKLKNNQVQMLINCLIASDKMLSGQKVDISFLDKINTGCANCGGDGCANCMLSPEERQELFN